MHNMSGYDMPNLLKGLTSNPENIEKIRVLPKGAYSYYNVKFGKASFIDSCSFIPASLGQLVDLKCKNVTPDKYHETIPLTVDEITRRYGPSH